MVPDRSHARIAAAVLAALLAPFAAIALAAPPAAFAQNILDTARENVDKFNKKTKQTEEAVEDAMRDGPPPPPTPPPGSNESTGDYFLRKYLELNQDYQKNKKNFDKQQKELDDYRNQLQALPKGDPGRAEIMKKFLEKAKEQTASRVARDSYRDRRQGFHDSIQDYKKRTGSYPPHNCKSAPGWHLPEGASCEGPEAPDPHGGSTPSPALSGHGP